jgi:hypothetical protein
MVSKAKTLSTSSSQLSQRVIGFKVVHRSLARAPRVGVTTELASDTHVRLKKKQKTTR